MKPQETPDTIHVRLTEPHIFTRYFEVASWYQRIHCEPQEHQVSLRPGDDFLVLFNGTIAKRHTPPRFGTHTADNPRDDKAKGAPATHGITIDAWHIRKAVRDLDDPTTPFTLTDTAPILITAVDPA